MDHTTPSRTEKQVRRTFGQHFTDVKIFETHILPEIMPHLAQYLWVDRFAGEGNLILPIVDQIPASLRSDFFRDHIRMYDVQAKWVEKAKANAIARGIPPDLADQCIHQRDSLKEFPKELLSSKYPIYHITNPPYLYLGYIAKTPDAKELLQNFTGPNEGYQDLYQLAMMSDLRNQIQQMVYIIPTNFFFGNSVSNKFRDDFLPYYQLTKVLMFESRIFKHTGTNVAICFCQRKVTPTSEPFSITALIDGTPERKKTYNLTPEYHYRAGSSFEDFVRKYRSINPLRSHYYLMLSDVEAHVGSFRIQVIDANGFHGNSYDTLMISVDSILNEKILHNPLWIRTIDTGTMEGRVGLYTIPESFGASGILVTKATYRTSPIQIFLDPPLDAKGLMILRKYFNFILEGLRQQTDSDFLTTYKYSDATYIRKYLGLSQAKRLLETFPWLSLTEVQKNDFERCLQTQDLELMVSFLQKLKETEKSADQTEIPKKEGRFVKPKKKGLDNWR